MDISKIEYPAHLNEHRMSQQTLDALDTPGKRAQAIEWAIFNNKIDWLIEEAVFVHNVTADHDKAFDLWKRIVWLGGILSFVIGMAFTVWKAVK